MPGHLYILSGASGCGKTTLLNEIVEDPHVNAVRAPKYSERAERGADDDIIHVDTIDASEHDLAYVINDNSYGIKTAEIEEQIRDGLNTFIILSDFRIIARLKDRFGDDSSAVYVSSAIDPDALVKVQGARHGFAPTPEQERRLQLQFFKLKSAARIRKWRNVFEGMTELVSDWREVLPEAHSTEIRAQKIKLFHNRYADKITLFDHVVLNYTNDRPDEMTSQMRNIMASRDAADSRLRPKDAPIVLVVAAASGAGKGLLMSTVGKIIGEHRVHIIPKMAKRDPKDDDQRDGMIAIGPEGEFPERYDFRWQFHESGTEYAIATDDIWDCMQSGRPQVVVSNMNEFPRFRERFGRHAVFVYLHSLRPEEDVRSYQYRRWDEEVAEQRLQEIRDVHDAYIAHIGEFDHVLLNTTFPEDLFDQAFELVSFYESASASTRVLSS